MGTPHLPDPLLNMAGFVPTSLVNGPGRRAVVWVQGCPIHCPGCFNPAEQEFVIKELVPVSRLAERILQIADLDGVTFSGGEPFYQAGALALLAERVKPAGLSIMCYTGYCIEEIRRSGRADWLHLLSLVDLLVDGPFRAELQGSFRWRGSQNQRLHFLTPRLRPYQEQEDEKTTLEIQIDANGEVCLSGFPTPRLQKGLLRSLGQA
ncbi:MAG: radical SAM protein [Nitrospinota bacterium]|nr:MAG: radical SAM protein [Nitrospinota bacterium]